MRGCEIAGLDLENFSSNSREVLIANNTVTGCLTGLRWYDLEPIDHFTAGQAEIAGNLIFEPTRADMVSIRGTGMNMAQPAGGDELVRKWRFHANWRDFSGGEAAAAIPLAKNDHRHTDWKFLSRQLGDPDYMRPESNALTTGGTGGDLPSYAGAVPPKGVKPWDWNVTWRSRMMRAKYRNKQKSTIVKMP